MVALWFKALAMPASITLKNIPDDIYDSLRNAANAHHRSLNGEAIACLQRVLMPSRLTPSERLAQASQLRASLSCSAFKAEDIAEAIKQNRP